MESEKYYETSVQTLFALFWKLKQVGKKTQQNSMWSGEMGMLAFLSIKPEGITAGGIARELHIGTGGVANMLNTLEKKGLIERSMSPHDRRSVIVRLSEQGKQLVECRRKEGQQRAAAFLERLGREDTEAMIRILQKAIAIGAEFAGQENTTEEKA